MGTITLAGRTVKYEWMADPAFDGERLAVLSDEGDIVFDISVPEEGPMTLNTFGKEVAVDLIVAALEVARRPQ
jgi:hypothetical protein